MYTPQDEMQRQANRDLNRYDVPRYESSTTSGGGLVAMLIVVVLIGGLIALSMLAPSSVDENGNLNTSPEATAPESISGGQATEATPAAPAQ